MKKIMYMAVAAIAVLSSCSSEEYTQSSNNGNNGEAKVFTGVIDNGDVTSRTSYSYDSSTKVGKVSWSSSDKVSINGAVYSVAPDGSDATKATFTYESGTAPTAAPYTAFYANGANTYYDGTTITLPSSYTYDSNSSFNMPMYAYNASDTKLSFQNVCGVLAVKVTSTEMSKVTSITVTSDKAICGECSITADASGNYSATATETAASSNQTVTLNCGDGVTPSSDGTVFYLPLPVLTASSTLYITVNGDVATDKANSYSPFIYTQSMKATGVTIARNTIYNVTFKTSLAKFTVGDNGGTKTVVNFTNANVYYNGSALQFESSQTAYPTSSSTTHAGHFSWNSTLASSAATTYSENGSTTYFASGVTVGSTEGLRVLTGGNNTGEYYYLITTRGTGLRKYPVTADGRSNCLIIAPDNFVGTLKSSYTAAELKAYGLVCLPPSGYRKNNETSVSHGTNGYYISATINSNKPYYLNFFNSNTITPSGNEFGRDLGICVRLVKTAE